MQGRYMTLAVSLGAFLCRSSWRTASAAIDQGHAHFCHLHRWTSSDQAMPDGVDSNRKLWPNVPIGLTQSTAHAALLA